MVTMFRKMPIRAKLILTIFFVATLVSVGGFLFIILTDISKLRDDAIRTAESNVAVISRDLVKVIVFGNAADAADVAAKMDSFQRIQSSYVYNKQGDLLYSYRRDGALHSSPPGLQDDGVSLKPGVIELHHPATYQGTRYGTIYMSLSTQELVARENEYYRLTAIIVIIFMALFYVSGYWIQRFFSRPIVALSKSVDQIATEQDYSRRLYTAHQDELGTLYHSFNQLLEVIETSRHSLQQSIARTDGILNVVGNAIVSIDDDNNILQFNRQAEQVFGYQAEEVLGRSLDILMPERFRQSHKKQVHEFGKEPVNIRTAMQREYISALRKGGIEFPIEASISKMNFDGKFIYTVALNDVSERLRIEKELARYRLHLEELVDERTRELGMAYKELEAFSYSVSHDLRAPLRRIDGFSQFLLEDHSSQLDADGQDYLRRIRSSAQRMSMLIDDMLSLSRVSRKDLKKARIDLSDLVRSVVSNLFEAGSDRQVNFAIQDTPLVECDPGLMHIALENLLQNAWNYTARTDQATISFSHSLDQDGQPVFELRDNGVGFDMRYVGKIFGVFERLHDDAEFKGTGIGLATVHRIIERHGGRIWAEGKPGEGAVFYFTLAGGNQSAGDR